MITVVSIRDLVHANVQAFRVMRVACQTVDFSSEGFKLTAALVPNRNKVEYVYIVLTKKVNLTEYLAIVAPRRFGANTFAVVCNLDMVNWSNS